MRSDTAQGTADAMGLLLVDCVLRGDEIIADPAEVLSLAKVAARLRAAKLFAEGSPRRPK